MKVLDLRCGQGHQFEGWFSSEDDYQAQRAKGLLACPVCDSLDVAKLLSAPYVAMKSNRQSASASTPVSKSTGLSHGTIEHGGTAAHLIPSAEQLQALEALRSQWIAHSRSVMEKGEDVGTAFAEKARRIHGGEEPERLIHGQASIEEVVDLLEEGVPIVPMAPHAKEPLQ